MTDMIKHTLGIVAILLTVSILLIPGSLFAWDEISHAKITDMAVDLVDDKQLKNILSDNRKMVRFGSWFPDWAQYGNHPFNNGSHSEVIAAYYNHLNKAAIKSRENHDRVLSHFMGAYAHAVQDFFLDSTIYTFMREIDNGVSDDLENGMMNIRLHGYLRISVEADYLYDDLVAVYSDLDMFSRDGLTPEKFKEEIDSHTKIQFLEMNGLRLLSFLTSSYIKNLMPWGAENMMTAPGGGMDCARATAKAWDALWDEMHGESPPLFVYSYPLPGQRLLNPDNKSMYGRITLVSAKPLDSSKFNSDSMELRSEKGEKIPGIVETYAYSENDRADLVVQFIPGQPLQHGMKYILKVNPGEYGKYDIARTPTYTIPFEVADSMDTAATVTEQGYEMGLFLLILLAGLGAVIYGFPAFVLSAVQHAQWERKESVVSTLPHWEKTVRHGFHLMGLIFIALGFYMFITKGVIFIEILRDIF